MVSADFYSLIAQELNVKVLQVAAVSHLLDEGGTVPFIARYRKEATDSLDEVAITNIRDRLQQLHELEKRRTSVLDSIKEQGKLTDTLKAKILAAKTMAVLEDIYLPYRPKRRTKGTVAKEKGLEPLAQIIFEQNGIDPITEAKKYIDPQKQVATLEEALLGARDIIAEWINEDATARAKLRQLYQEQAVITSAVIRGKDVEGVKYKDYYAWQEPANKAPSHRILAVRRGEKEGILVVKIQPDENEALKLLDSLFVKSKKDDSRQVQMAVADSFKRLLSLSLETEIRLELKKRADQEAIEVFSQNLRELLMAPPLGQKNMIAIDPGQRTGCKIVCLSAQGKLLHHDVIYLVGSPSQREDAAETMRALCKKYEPQVIAIGNGTASRETEQFVRSLKLSKDIHVLLVNESGASIYSASDVAREEFPDHDITVRGAVSIGRRLMDPLAELVKIDPKSIGVGQYQHDVDQKLLKDKVDDLVISCVNQVGVEVNTASKQLLMYVAGLGPTRAQAIVEYRNTKGAFSTRDQLRNIPGLGPKAFEQAAGFLRIYAAANPLDASAVHPEAYPIVEQIAQDMNASLKDLIQNQALLNKIDLKKYVTDKIGLPTLKDIKQELIKPGRDPRAAFTIFKYADGVHSIDDLKPGMKLPGVVTNITAFGAFVDIGVHQDGLIHISQLSDRFVKDPHEVVKVHQTIKVTVLEIDKERNRIALSAKTKV